LDGGYDSVHIHGEEKELIPRPREVCGLGGVATQNPDVKVKQTYRDKSLVKEPLSENNQE
jgi:hypothetical protein